MAAKMNDYDGCFYSILEAHQNASQDEIKRCYQKKLLKYHPDKVDPSTPQDAKQQAMAMYSAIDNAWQILGNPVKRKEYDARRKEEKLNVSLPLFDTVPLDELDWDEDSECYGYTCRCGGEYTLSDDDAQEQIELVCCDTCTLGLRIIYSEETTIEQTTVEQTNIDAQR